MRISELIGSAPTSVESHLMIVMTSSRLASLQRLAGFDSISCQRRPLGTVSRSKACRATGHKLNGSIVSATLLRRTAPMVPGFVPRHFDCAAFIRASRLVLKPRPGRHALTTGPLTLEFGQFRGMHLERFS
jgi:hypothetical protein